jgi:hypothetical protein
VQPIETCVATLEPVDTYASVSSYVVSYKNQIEKEAPPAKNILVRTGDSEIIEQFMTICSFHMGAFFHQDRNIVAVACRDQKFNSSDYCIPSQFVPRIFSRQIRGTVEETESLSEFVNDVIGLKRDRYNSILISLRSFSDAMQVIGTNIDLAYSLLIYSLEALAQRSDAYLAVWEDYPLDTKDALDKIFNDLDERHVDDIKNTLLKNSNLKATKRFLSFVKSHIDDEFYMSEAPSGFATVRKSEFDRALKNAYAIRSKFAHLLQPIQEQLRHPNMANGDVVRLSNEPYFSVSGLVRIVQHVIKNYVKNNEKVDSEKFNWRQELPGIMKMEMAPQYWIWKHEGLQANHATNKLSGFLSQLETVISGSEPITDIRELLVKYENLIGQSSNQFKIQILTTYVLYNAFVSEEHKCKNYSSVLDKNKALFDICTIETMLAWLLMGQLWPWVAEECAECWSKYQSTCYQKASIKVPPIMSVGIICEIASLYLQDENEDEYRKFMESAIIESAGQKELQESLIQAKSQMHEKRGMEVFDKLDDKEA